jgi:hypothetical protein
VVLQLDVDSCKHGNYLSFVSLFLKRHEISKKLSDCELPSKARLLYGVT